MFVQNSNTNWFQHSKQIKYDIQAHQLDLGTFPFRGDQTDTI